jgi:RimJ/RimL family protein N-acetyltransferase
VDASDPPPAASDATPLRPDRWDVDVVLSSGRVARVRAIRPDDAEALRDFHSRLSAETRLMRFFTPMPKLPESLVQRFVNVDNVDRVALVMELDEEIIAVGRYDRDPDRPNEAEVAFTVDDRFQGEGIGSLLLEHLAAIGLEQGIDRFTAETLAGNEAMLRVFSRAGFSVTRRLSGGVFDVSFPIEPTEESERLRAQREHRATVASLRRLLQPRTVAVLGADSHRDAHIRLVASTFDGTFSALGEGFFPGTFTGRMLPVGQLEEGVDLVLIDLPADEVPEAVADCAAHDAGAVLIVSGGFADAGPEGATAERELVRFARRHGMRVVGPNSLGMANTDPGVNLCLVSHDLVPEIDDALLLRAGRVGVFSHSPALARSVLAALTAHELGVSAFVSAGNKADVSGNDLMEFWEDDPRTAVIVLAVESFGNPRRFARLAERITRVKPIVMVAPNEPGVAALCRRSGVIRVDDISALASTVARLVAEEDAAPGQLPRTALLARQGAAELDDAECGTIDEARLEIAEQVLANVGVGVVRDGALDLLLDAIGLRLADPLPPDVGGSAAPGGVVRGRQDTRFGPLVELEAPTGPLRVALAPLTRADVDQLGGGSEALEDVLRAVACAIEHLPDLAEITVVLDARHQPTDVIAVAAPSPQGAMQIVRRLT